METITIKNTDDRYKVREALRRTTAPRVLFVLPWDVEEGWQQPLDYELLLREIQERGTEAAWVIDDPERRPLAKEAGFPVFSSELAAQTHLQQAGSLPALRTDEALPEQPKRPVWAEAPQQPKSPPVEHRRQPVWLILLELALLLGVLGIVVGAGALALPSASIVLVPSGVTYNRVVPISVDPELETVDLQRGVIPSQRIGDEFEGYAQVGTTGLGFSFSGRATGRVLFTNLLGQDYRVPQNTVVRTTAGSYPVRYQTTEEVTVPAFGQVEAAVEALEEGPRGNVDAYQINLVEGVVGFALRVTNPAPITGAESATVATVSEADRDRAWELAAQQVLAEAYNGLQSEAYLEPGEFLPRQTLVIQSAPNAAYTNLIGEQADSVGVTLRLLVTGQKVQASDAQAVAYGYLARQLPEGYTLTDARFEYGESAEEDVGPGKFTFYVTAYGYASANLETETALESIKGKRVEEAIETLQQDLSLAKPPQITVTPDWFPFLPFLSVRTEIEVIPGKMVTASASGG